MPSKRRRSTPSAFNLSFLDIMFCGFGAVVLLVLIVNSQTVRSRNERHQDLRAQVELLETEVKAEKRLVAKLKNSIEKIDANTTKLNGRSEVLLSEIKRTDEERARLLNLSAAERQHINRLQSELKSMERKGRRRLASSRMDKASGRKALRFTGQGHRQYLTGLKLGGSRILVLVDASASMLDATIINILRRRNLSGKRRTDSAKWQQTLRTARWLLANLPLESRVRVAVFNTKPTPLGDSASRWIPVKDDAALETIISELSRTVPEKGTNLYRAFSLASSMHPAPDNIILLTDGLPTIGASPPSSSKVTSEERLNCYMQAASRLPSNVPVNTILFPLEGDPLAASMYWRLAVKTKGSFLTPSRDWP